MIIKPTVGRVVWFWSSTEHSKAGQDGSAQPLPALVTHVYSDDCVNLAVFDKEGDHFPHPVVTLWQGEGERPTGCCYCEWMPYQKGQAAKQETGGAPALSALEARVSELEAKLKLTASSAAAAVPPTLTQSNAQPQPQPQPALKSTTLLSGGPTPNKP